ncbi:hypothetical protein HK098_008137 [Nowakowskiella sp. JEL0407]|nr:hypothetical protein HK098_008137 [Nowakowskiella sp. JEL0407]
MFEKLKKSEIISVNTRRRHISGDGETSVTYTGTKITLSPYQLTPPTTLPSNSHEYTDAAKPSDIESLPSEILHLILSHLDKKTWLSCLFLSKIISSATLPFIWKEPPIKFLTARDHSDAKSHSDSKSPCLNVFRGVLSLFSLKRSACDSVDDTETDKVKLPFNIIPTPENGKFVQNIALTASSPNPHLISTTSSLDCNSLNSMIKLCPKIVRLNLRGCVEAVNDETLEFISRNLKSTLRSLDISQCSKITDHGVAMLSLCMLESLSLNGLTNLSDDGLESSTFSNTLRRLRISDTKVTGRGVVRFLQKRTKIEELDLARCREIDDETVDCITAVCGERLKWLSLARVQVPATKKNADNLKDSEELKLSDEAIRYFAERCPNLELLDLAYIPTFTDECVKYIVDKPGMRKLVSLVVTGCSGVSIESLGRLSSLRQRFGNLSTITIGDCPAISDQHIAQLISPTGWLAGWRKSVNSTDLKVMNKSWDDIGYKY